MRHHEGGDVDQPGAVIWHRRYQYALGSNRLIATRLPGDPDNLPSYAAAPGYSAKYTYDARGNMATLPHLPSVGWNAKAELRLTTRQVANAGAPDTTFYVYSAGGQRVRKVTVRNGVRREER